MHEWDFSMKIAVYGLASVLVTLAITLLFFGDNSLLSGDSMHTDILHSNYVMPHIEGH